MFSKQRDVDKTTYKKWKNLDEKSLSSRVIELANFYADRPAMAAQMIKRSINAIQLANSGIMHMDGDQNALTTAGEDFKKARESFIRKKK